MSPLIKANQIKNLELGPAGQALVEFTICSFVLALVLAGAWGIWGAWRSRTRCAYLAFQQARSALAHEATGIGSLQNLEAASLKASRKLMIHYEPAGVTAEAWCGKAHERVHLPYLESWR